MNASDASLLIFTLVVCWSLYRAHIQPDNSFNLFDLIMENGRVSRIGFGFIVALFVTSWVLIRVARDGHDGLDLLFAAYCTAWVAPIVAKLFSASPPAGVTTTSSTTTSTKEIT